MHTSFIKILFILGLTPLQTIAQVNIKNAHKAVLNIFSYDKNGTLLKSGTAFFIDKDSNVATSFDILKGAYKAEIIDSKGKKYNILRVLGANSTTNLVKISTDAPKNNNYFSISTDKLITNSKTKLIRYSSNRINELSDVTITRVEDFNEYNYYETDAENNDKNLTCPLLDKQGQISAILQFNVNKAAFHACAIDAHFLNQLSINGTSSLDIDLNAINIPKALPSNIKEALTYLYMYPTNDSVNYKISLDDFILKYPNISDGYIKRAAYYASQKMYEACENDFKAAILKASNDSIGISLDYTHFSISNLIYQTILASNDTSVVYKDWTLTRAESEVQKAYNINHNTLYLLQQAKIAYSQDNFDKAYHLAYKVCEDKNFATPENYFFTAKCLESFTNDSTSVLSLLDSCISAIPQPVSVNNASYYLERAQRLIHSKLYRKAIFDYYEYEKIIGPANLTADFYYIRQQLEMNASMYQQALDDIRTAISISNKALFYRIEEAFILMRVGEFDDAINAAQAILINEKNNVDCLKILGISYGALGNKTKAIKYLQKAQSLGDNSVNPIIEQYEDQ